jgi:hypothetical protein
MGASLRSFMVQVPPVIVNYGEFSEQFVKRFADDIGEAAMFIVCQLYIRTTDKALQCLQRHGGQ